MTDINIENISYIKQLINIYADMALLDTESSIEYPKLAQLNSINNKHLIKYWNSIYAKELPTKKEEHFCNNVVINVTALSKLLNTGRCLVYYSFKNNRQILLLERYLNIRDFIIPCEVAIKLLPEINTKNDCFTKILQYYMGYKAINSLNNFNNEREKEKLIIVDNLIYTSRNINNFIDKPWEQLKLIERGLIIKFISRIISQELASNENINLETLLNENKDVNDFINEHYNCLLKKAKILSYKSHKTDIRNKK